MLLLAVPGTANCFTLDQLLELPFEQLLRLEITSRRFPHVDAVRPRPPNATQTAEHHDAT